LAEVRTRFAPSPTGFLHLGGARTALFNWAFARKEGGKFILRIEDTDVARSTEEAVEVILDSLRWLGLHWDEGPYFQSQRLEIYRKYALLLWEKGLAYECFCTPEELKERRQETMAQGESWRYDRKCWNLKEEEKEKLKKEGRKSILRFYIPPGETTFIDMLRGEVHFHNEELDDFVIMKSDGMPTYNFACVVDDALMEISHIIRGDDHISNTPRQVLLYQAFNFPIPQFAHIPMILGKDKTRLSKRHGSPSVTYYRDQGYLPDALFNYLARLSWASGEEEKEIFSREEIVERFSIENVTKHAAVFDLDKLNWMNSVYIRQADNKYLCSILEEILVRRGRIKPEEITPSHREYWEKVIALMKERIKYVAQLEEEASYFFTEEIEFDPVAFEEVLRREGVEEILKECEEVLSRIEDFRAPVLEEAVREMAKKRGVKAAQIIHPLRVAVSGKKVGPGLFELLEVLGKERVIGRIQRARQQIKEGYPFRDSGDE